MESVSRRHEPARLKLRQHRSHTRRHLRDPRPSIAPAIRARLAQWKAQIEAAQMRGAISKGCHLYLNKLASLPSVVRGGFAFPSDRQMGAMLNASARTARRHRKEGEGAGLLEVQGHGEDHQPCLVRPRLADGAVFEPIKTDRTGQLSRPKVATKLATTELERTPLPPSQSVHVREDHPKWRSCDQKWRQQHRTGAPIDRQGGWYFPAEWVAEASAPDGAKESFDQSFASPVPTQAPHHPRTTAGD